MLSRQLFDTSLNLTHPTTLPPAFWKHDEENRAHQQKHASIGPDPFTAPKGAYKLLCSDYDWLTDPVPAKGKAGTPSTAAEDDPNSMAGLPEPPAALKQSRYIARARTVLVKLQQQVRECVDQALEAAATEVEMAQQHPLLLPSTSRTDHAAATPSNSNTSRPSLYAHTRPALLTPHTEPASVTTATTTGAGQGPSIQVYEPSMIPLSLAQVSEQFKVKLEAMFEDCMMDLMDQLWAALQCAGSTQAKVGMLQQAMAQRDQELESIAMVRAAQLEKNLSNMKAQLEKAAETLEAEKSRTQSIALAHSSQAEQLARANAKVQAAIGERDRLGQELDATRAAHRDALLAIDAEYKVHIEGLQRNLGESSQQLAALREKLRTKECELAETHTRLSEQLAMLENACARRDMEVKRCEDTAKTVDEFVALVSDQGRHSVSDWVGSLEESAADGVLCEGELMEGPYGLAKASLLSAKNLGLSRALRALKAGLPAELPRHRSQQQGTDPVSVRVAPRITRLAEEYVPGLVPGLWVRLLSAPLAEQMPLKELCRHIHELYDMKDAADSAAQASGLPTPSLHTAIYKCYLVKNQSADLAERDAVQLIQSVRAHAAASTRVNTFSLFLGLQKPGLPAGALNVYLAYRRALRTISPHAPAPTCVDEEDGVVSWVHPSKWRAVLTGPLARHADGSTAKAVLRAVQELKTQPARSQPSFGMTDMDSLLEVVMQGWSNYVNVGAPAHLKSVFEAHRQGFNGVFTLGGFRELLGNTNVALTFDEVRSLELLHQALEATAAEPKDPKVARGAVSLSAYSKICIDQGVVGSLATPASAADLNRLASALELLLAMHGSLKTEMAANALQVSAADRVQTELVALNDRVHAAQGGEPAVPAPPIMTTTPPAAPPVLDAHLLNAMWGDLVVAGRELLQVQASVQQQAAEKHKAAADMAAAKEQLLQQRLESANQATKAAVDERNAAQEAATKAEAMVVTLQAMMSEIKPQALSGPNSRPSRLSKSGMEGSGGNMSPIRRTSPLHSTSRDLEEVTEVASCSPRVSQGGEGDVAALRAELQRCQKRATDAEGRYSATRAQVVELTAALDKAQDKLAKRKATDEKSAAAKLLAGLGKLFDRIQRDAGANPVHHLARLMEIAGFLQGIAAGLEETTACRQQAQQARAPVAEPGDALSKPQSQSPSSSPSMQCTDAPGPEDGAGIWPALRRIQPTPHAEPSVADSSGKLRVTLPNEGDSPDGGPHDLDAQEEFLFAARRSKSAANLKVPDSTAAGQAASPKGKVLTPRKSVGSGRLRSPSQATDHEGGVDIKSRRSMPLGSPSSGKHTPTSPGSGREHTAQESAGDLVPVLDRAGKGAKDALSRTYLLGALHGATTGRLHQSRRRSSGYGDGSTSSSETGAVDEVVSPSGRRFSVAFTHGREPADLVAEDLLGHWLDCSLVSVLETAKLAAIIHRDTQALLSEKDREVKAHKQQLKEAQTALQDLQDQTAALSAALDQATAAAVAPGLPTAPSCQSLMSSQSVLTPKHSVPEATHIDSAGTDREQESGQTPEETTSETTGSGSPQQDLPRLLLHGFEMYAEDLQPLAHAVLAVVHSAGGFPLLSTDGSIVKAAGGQVLVSPEQAAQLPDLPAQAEALRHLYVSCAGLLLAQYLRANRMSAVEAALCSMVDALRDATPAKSSSIPALSATSQRDQGVARQLKLLSSTLAAMRRHARHCTEKLAALQATGYSQAGIHVTRSPDPSVPADQTHSAGEPQTSLGEGASQADSLLASLQEELSHADIILSQVQQRVDVGRTDSPEAAPEDHDTAAESEAASAQQRIADVLRSRSEVPASSILTHLLDLHPSQLYLGMFSSKAVSCGETGARRTDAPQSPPQVQASAAQEPILCQFPDVPTPPSSPSQENGLPPGEAIVLLSPALLQRSDMAAPRYLYPQAPPHRSLPPGALLANLPQDVVMPRRYERRPYTARRYMEALLYEGALTQPGPQRLWMTQHGEFWAQRHDVHQMGIADNGEDRPVQVSGSQQGSPRRPHPDGVSGPWPWWHPALRSLHQPSFTQHPSLQSHVHSGRAMGPVAHGLHQEIRQRGASGLEAPVAPATSNNMAAGSGHTGSPTCTSGSEPIQRTRPQTSGGRLQSMSSVVARGQVAALTSKLRHMAPSPELAGWSDQAPAYPHSHVASMSQGALASGALANGGPQPGVSPPRHRVSTLAAQAPPSLFPGVRVDSSGRLTSKVAS